jgi:GNAT superfamily N-acetyltransferase
VTERTIFLDPGRRASRTSRMIRVSASRWYATVTLDRDAYVDATSSPSDDSDLPADFTEALNRAQKTCFDRIWYDGYPGGFSYSHGSRWVTLFVPFTNVNAAVEALRAAELDNDHSKLHALADSLTLPIDEWLAPGEKELIRGVDFHTQPQAFLRFLRGKAKQRGLRLNGRATAGSVWVRPTLPPIEKLIRERRPEQYPGWVDRWTGHVEPDTASIRPWVGSRGQNLSSGSRPVEFRDVNVPSVDQCPCGMRPYEHGDIDDTEHTKHHMAWLYGVRVPRNLEWWGDLAMVTTQSPVGWRKLAYQVARTPQKENGYDFRSWPYPAESKEDPLNKRAYLLRANRYVIGYLTASDVDRHRRWDLVDGSRFGEQDDSVRPCIDLIWVADAHRRMGVGAALVQTLADHFGCQVGDVSWSGPVSGAGRRLARRISPSGIWVS